MYLVIPKPILDPRPLPAPPCENRERRPLPASERGVSIPDSEPDRCSRRKMCPRFSSVPCACQITAKHTHMHEAKNSKLKQRGSLTTGLKVALLCVHAALCCVHCFGVQLVSNARLPATSCHTAVSVMNRRGKPIKDVLHRRGIT